MSGLARNWSAFVLRGLVAVVFGAVALLLPDLTIGVVIGIFGAFTIVFGVVAVVSALIARRSRSGWVGDLVEGVVAIAVGAFVLAWPELTASGVLIAIGLFALAVGVVELVTALALRRVLRRIWPLMLAGLVSGVFGIVLLGASSEGAVTLAWLVGLYAIAFGVSLIAFGLSLRRVASAGGLG